MIYLDSNVPMYVVGGEHPNKDAALRLLAEVVSAREPLITSVEVLQEILHRYNALDRVDAIQPAFDWLLRTVVEVLPITMPEMTAAKDIVLSRYGISARDALHIAVMRANEIDRILSFDTGFDRVPGIRRLARGLTS